MEICFEGIGQVVATFQAEGELAGGMAVTLTGSGKVGLGESGKPLCGVTACAARDGEAAVQISGAAQVAYSGEKAPEAGWNALACDGKGGVTVAEEGGQSCLVLAVDADAKTAVVRL